MCLWFDDGDAAELVCGCGARAVAVVDESTGESMVVALDRERVLVAMAASA